MSQQIYLPLGGQYTIPYEFEADTMPVPRGQSSVLWELRDGNLTAAEAIIKNTYIRENALSTNPVNTGVKILNKK